MKKIIIFSVALFSFAICKAQQVDTTLTLCNDFNIHLSYSLDKGYLSSDAVYLDFTEESVLFRRVIEKVKGVETVHTDKLGKYSMLVFVGEAFDKEKVVQSIINAVKDLWCQKPKIGKC